MKEKLKQWGWYAGIAATVLLVLVGGIYLAVL
jgi:hypothetical protein